MLKIFVITFCLSAALPSWANIHRPIEPKERLGWSVGVRRDIVLGQLDANPLNFSAADIQPPMITAVGNYQPNYNAVFQPDIHLGASWLKGGGQYIYLQGGGWFDFPKFHLFFGGEYFSTFSAGDYGISPIDHSGAGAYIRGAVPLGFLYPSLEIRYREISETEVANREGLSTYVEHGGDRIYRPAIEVDLLFIQLWGAFTYFDLGNTAIASDGFGLGIEGKSLTMYSAGVGFELSGAYIWVKGHHLSGIEDEIAHYYQVPQIYPDFLLAKESLSVEFKWLF